MKKLVCFFSILILFLGGFFSLQAQESGSGWEAFAAHDSGQVSLDDRLFFYTQIAVKNSIDVCEIDYVYVDTTLRGTNSKLFFKVVYDRKKLGCPGRWFFYKDLGEGLRRAMMLDSVSGLTKAALVEPIIATDPNSGVVLGVGIGIALPYLYSSGTLTLDFVGGGGVLTTATGTMAAAITGAPAVLLGTVFYSFHDIAKERLRIQNDVQLAQLMSEIAFFVYIQGQRSKLFPGFSESEIDWVIQSADVEKIKDFFPNGKDPDKWEIYFKMLMWGSAGMSASVLGEKCREEGWTQNQISQAIAGVQYYIQAQLLGWRGAAVPNLKYSSSFNKLDQDSIAMESIQLLLDFGKISYTDHNTRRPFNRGYFIISGDQYDFQLSIDFQRSNREDTLYSIRVVLTRPMSNGVEFVWISDDLSNKFFTDLLRKLLLKEGANVREEEDTEKEQKRLVFMLENNRSSVENFQYYWKDNGMDASHELVQVDELGEFIRLLKEKTPYAIIVDGEVFKRDEGGGNLRTHKLTSGDLAEIATLFPGRCKYAFTGGGELGRFIENGFISFSTFLKPHEEVIEDILTNNLREDEPASKKLILVLEDNPADQRLLKDWFFDVFKMGDDFDLVITDDYDNFVSKLSSKPFAILVDGKVTRGGYIFELTKKDLEEISSFFTGELRYCFSDRHNHGDFDQAGFIYLGGKEAQKILLDIKSKAE